MLVFPQTAVECHCVSLEILMYSELPIEFPKLPLYIDQETEILEISYVKFLIRFLTGMKNEILTIWIQVKQDVRAGRASQHRCLLPT